MLVLGIITFQSLHFADEEIPGRRTEKLAVVLVPGVGDCRAVGYYEDVLCIKSLAEVV